MGNNRVVVYQDQTRVRINRHIYGHFIEHLGHCIYGGLWVGEDSPVPNIRGVRSDIINALKHIKIPNLRWPGGCFADQYHWKNGIGKRSERPLMPNYVWGGVEGNSFGTHEFLDLCAELGCEPYICGNLGTGTIEEMFQWVEYINGTQSSPITELRKKNGRDAPWKLSFWGIGNESYADGGMMSAEFYVDNYRRYSNAIKAFGPLNRIACGPNNYDYHWTEVLMKKALKDYFGKNGFWGLALHHYTLLNEGDITGNVRGYATDFNESEWFLTMARSLAMDGLVRKHGAIMDEYDPGRQAALVIDEWGCFHNPEKGTDPALVFQQNSLMDALAAGIQLNIFNNYAERIRMANLAQTINVVHSLILTEGDAMILTPTYHVFDLYKAHQDAIKLPLSVECESYTVSGNSVPALNASASMDGDYRIHISFCNLDPNREMKTTIEIPGFAVESVSGRIVSSGSMQDHNTVNKPDLVKSEDYNDAVLSKRSDRSIITLSIPAKSVTMLEIS